MSKTDSNAQTKKPVVSMLAIMSLALGIAWIVFLIQWSLSVWLTLSLLIGLGALGGILGVGALIMMRKKGGTLLGWGAATIGILASTMCVLVMGFSLLMGYEMKLYRAEYFGHEDKRVACANRLIELNTAISVHANPADYYKSNEPQPGGGPLKWCDLLLQWGDRTAIELLICPGAKEGPCSYAINKYAVEIWEDIPKDMVKLFESKPGWNQIGGPELLSTDNHNGQGCNVLFGNNVVKFLKPEELGKLRWKIEEGEDR